MSSDLQFSVGMSRYELTDFEYRVVEPLSRKNPRGVPRVDDRRVLNGIFGVLRSGSPWRDLPVKLIVTPGQTHVIKAAVELLSNIPPKTDRKAPICFSPWLYQQLNLVECVFNSAVANDPGGHWAIQILLQDLNAL